jgi:hypothetical protein
MVQTTFRRPDLRITKECIALTGPVAWDLDRHQTDEIDDVLESAGFVGADGRGDNMIKANALYIPGVLESKNLIASP